MTFRIRTLFGCYVVCCFYFAITDSVKFQGSDIRLNNSISDVFLDSFELLAKYGYSPVKCSVSTEDGYILNLFHIPRKGPPVLLVHGWSDSSDEWLVLGPQRSLAYQLADIGFDVWLFNARGNRYSKGHHQFISKEEYWDFSYEEIGSLDLPASIDYILNVTSQEKIFYVGFSQGTTVFLVLCSLRPEYNNKIKEAVLLAPVAWVSNLKYPFIGLLSENLDIIYTVAKSIGLYELFPFDFRRELSRLLCYRSLPHALCNTDYYVSFGLKNSSYLSPDKLAVIDSHTPAGISAKTVVHFIQGYGSKSFRRFDYGSTKNFVMYASKLPPVYNISLITTPLNIIASEEDWFSQIDDVQTLRRKLPNIKKFILINATMGFSHLEFVYGTRVNSLVNNVVKDVLFEHLNDL